MNYVKAGVVLIITLVLITGISCATTQEKHDNLLTQANQDHAEAQYKLGVMYYKGKDVPQDYAMAYMWFRLAFANEHANATRKMIEIEKKMTPSQIKEANKLQREWIDKQNE